MMKITNNKLIFKVLQMLATIFVILATICILMFNNSKKVLANNNADMFLVFDKTTYNIGETVNLTINLDKFSSLNEIKLQIKIKSDLFEPIITEGRYFYFSSASIFTTDIINDYVDNSYLRLRLIKNEEIDDGYFSSYKNNICHLKLKVKKAIDNIYQYFTQEGYETNGISAYLFDTFDQLINFNIISKEKIKINWEKESYELDVFSNVPNFKEDIRVLNREITEYEYLVEKTIDTNIIGLKTIHIGIYDKTTADYIILSKPVVITDRIAPVIEYPNSIEITDKIVYSKDYLENFLITDNYDTYFDIKVIYYNKELEVLNTRDDFNLYLSSNELGYLKVIAKDNSLNETLTELVEIKVLDTTAPMINEINQIVINDVDLEGFDLETYFTIEDEYDNNPSIVLNYLEHNSLTFEEIKRILSKGSVVNFEYFAKDQSNNITTVYQCMIIVIDTTSPSLVVEDVIISDVEFSPSKYQEKVLINDNFSSKCNVIKKYYINDNLVEETLFIEEIQKGSLGYVEYQVIDDAGNCSDVVRQNITIIDTTKPIIKIKNIENNQKYLKIEKIEYEVFDNFDNLLVTILLDDVEYLDTKVEIGKHTFKIIAKDEAGNETIEEINFQIIEDNIIGCGDDVSCYITNYLEIVIIVGALLLFVLIMIVTSIIIKRRKNKIS